METGRAAPFKGGLPLSGRPGSFHLLDSYRSEFVPAGDIQWSNTPILLM